MNKCKQCGSHDIVLDSSGVSESTYDWQFIYIECQSCGVEISLHCDARNYKHIEQKLRKAWNDLND